MCNEQITIIVENTVDSSALQVTSEETNISLEVTESTTDVSVLAVEQVSEVSVEVINEVNNIEIIVSDSTGASEFTLSDDLIIVAAGKQSNTFVNNVFTFVDTLDYINNTKTLIYTGALLTSSVHLFRYNSLNWSVNYTYNYNLGDYNGVNRTITKS